jgi:hypothetical protein
LFVTLHFFLCSTKWCKTQRGLTLYFSFLVIVIVTLNFFLFGRKRAGRKEDEGKRKKEGENEKGKKNKGDNSLIKYCLEWCCKY